MRSRRRSAPRARGCPRPRHGDAVRELAEPRHGEARLQRLPTWKSGRRLVRVESEPPPTEEVDAARLRREPQVIGGALVGEVRPRGKGFVNGEAIGVGKD